MILFFILTVFLCIVPLQARTIAATGEFHGAQQSFSALKEWQLHNNDALLFDAGGFCAGGLYDPQSSTHQNDSLRSMALCSLLSVIQYSAIAIGDEELQYGVSFWEEVQKKYALPLVASNVIGSDSLFQRSLSFLHKGQKIAVVSVCSEELFLSRAADFSVVSPFDVLPQILDSLSDADYVVLLSHISPNETNALLEAFPQIDLAIQGHRKNTSEAMISHDTQAVLQFRYLGEAMAVFNGKVAVWHDLEAKLPESPETFPIPVDLALMSSCPYSNDALRTVLPFLHNPLYAFRFFFTGSFQHHGDSLAFLPSLNDGDVRGERIWMAVETLLPQRFPDFLWLVADQSLPIEQAAKEIGLDSLQFAHWNATQGETMHRWHYERNNFLGITSAPTFSIRGEVLPLSPRLTLRNLCIKTNDQSTECALLGECDTDIECPNSNTGPGWCDSTGEKSRCAIHPEPPVHITIVLPQNSMPFSQKIADLLTATHDLLPTLQHTILTDKSPEGKSLIAQYEPERLPLILFDTTVKDMRNFSLMQNRLQELPDAFRLLFDDIPDGYYHSRKQHPREIVVLADSTLIPSFREELKTQHTSWYLSKEDEMLGWMIWWENQTLFTGIHFEDAQSILDSLSTQRNPL